MSQKQKTTPPDPEAAARIHPDLYKKLIASAKENHISCANVHRAAKDLNLTPLEIGEKLDLLGFRITECQLGLFGYGKMKKKLNPEIDIPSEVKAQIHAVQTDGRISCLACWQLGKKTTLSRLDIGSACEKENIRIKPCQLGAF